MTDPRMTPTNDAPVTAEQCDRDFTADILDFIAGLNTFPDAMRHSASCMRQGAKGEAQFRPLTDMLARHRLAALASAPAGDGMEEDKIVSRAVEQVMRGFSFETLAGPENLRARLSLCARQAVHDTAAALARPRAAVGEQSREAIGRLIDPDAWHDTLPQDGCGPYWMGRRIKACEKADAILQSPPAKVEG